MLMVGFDLGKRKSWVVMEDENGKILVDKKIKTTLEDLHAVLGGIGSATVLLEASTSSEWVARALEAMGHTVVVADPNFAPMYASADKRIKTDRRDAHALLTALKLKAYRTTVRRSDQELQTKAMLSARDALVRSRAKLINRTRATLQRFGIADSKASADSFADWVRRDCGRERVVEILEPSLRVIDDISRQVSVFDAALTAEATQNPVVARLDKIPGVGALTALAFVYAISDVDRFASANAVAAYLGLVPSINASGDREFRGGITKRGDRVARTLLHEASLHIMRSKDPRVSHLRDWGHELARRRGGKKKGGEAIARSAISRRLARIMFAMCRDGKDFNAELTAGRKAPEAVAAE